MNDLTPYDVFRNISAWSKDWLHMWTLTSFITAGGCAVRLMFPEGRKTKHRLKKIFERTRTFVIDKKGNVIYPLIKTIKEEKYLTIIVLELPDGLTPGDIEHIAEQIEYSFMCEMNLTVKKKDVILYLHTGEIPDRFDYITPDYEKLFNEYHIPLLIGKSYEGEIIADLHEMVMLLVAGETGSGKGNQLLVFTQSLIRLVKIGRIEFTVCDPAQTDFTFLSNYGAEVLPATLEDPFPLFEYINQLELEMARRTEILKESGCVKITEYNEKYPENPLKFKVLLIDELAIFRIPKGADKEIKAIYNEAFHKLCNIGAVGRKTGIHLILCTQAPYKEVIPPLLRDNVPAKVCFKTNTPYNSINVLGHAGAYSIKRNKGRGIFQWTGDKYIQTPHLPFDLAKEYLKEYETKSHTQDIKNTTPVFKIKN